MGSVTIAARAVIDQPEMNRTEEKYAWVLEHRKLAGEILFYEFGVITLRIGNDCRYTPDFLVVNSALEVELHEVKGFMRDDALVKLKAAAAHYPFRFFLAKYDRTGWDVKEVPR